jgi:hypothetical protein
MTGDSFLETLQADVVSLLKAVPSLTDLNIIPEDDGDMEAKILRQLGALTGGGTGKAGCVAVVMLPVVDDAEENLPGPPLNVNVRVQVIEQHLINRGDSGTGVRSSVGALRVLNALHHHSFSYAALYAGKNPVEPVDVKKGFLSHMVTLRVNYSGLSGPGKPAEVTAEVGGDAGAAAAAAATIDPAGNDNAVVFTAVEDGEDGNAISVEYAAPGGSAQTTVSVTGTAITVTPAAKARMILSGTLTDYYGQPVTTPLEFLFAGFQGDKPVYAAGPLSNVMWFGNQWAWYLDEVLAFYSTQDVATPDLVTSWTPNGSATGTPVVTAAVASAAQVISAVNGSVAASALVTASASGASTGAVAAVAETNLTGGAGGASLTLACATAAASIYYTTDGSYPDSTNGTLYTAPFALPDAGTVIRAAAYKTGLNPGDVTELVVTP